MSKKLYTYGMAKHEGFGADWTVFEGARSTTEQIEAAKERLRRRIHLTKAQRGYEPESDKRALRKLSDPTAVLFTPKGTDDVWTRPPDHVTDCRDTAECMAAGKRKALRDAISGKVGA